VRLGYTCAVALRWFLLRATLHAMTNDGVLARIARELKEPEEFAVQRLILLSRFPLDRAVEARGLVQRLAERLHPA
jgi:hypothetical protein